MTDKHNKDGTPEFEGVAATALAEEVHKLKDELVGEFKKGLQASDDRAKKLEDNLNAKMTELRKELDRRSPTISVPGVGVDDPGKFSLGKAIQSMRIGGFNKSSWEENGAGYEYEVVKEARVAWEKKAMGALGTGAAGAFIVPEQLMSEQFIPLLRANTVSIELGASVLNMPDATPVNIPRQDAGATASWVGENPASAISATDLTLGNVQLIPKRLAARTTHSEELGAWSSPDISNLIAQDHAAQLARGLDLAALKGSGSSNQPLGIIQALNGGAQDRSWTGTIASGATDAAAYLDLMAMEGLVADNNGLQGSLGWAMHPKTLRTLRLIRSEASSSPFLEFARNVVSSGAPTSVIGYPFRQTTQLTGTNGSAEIIFGNWRELMIARWGGLMLKTTDAVGEAAAKFQFDVISSIFADVGIRHIASFSISNNVATA